jgi:ribosomal protein S18 acetylase RimI-like enzyme
VDVVRLDVVRVEVVRVDVVRVEVVRVEVVRVEVVRVEVVRVEVREVLPVEYQRAGRLVVDAYRSVPGAHMTGGYEAELADVARRAVEASVLVAVSGAQQQLLGCVTYVPDSSSPWAENLRDGEASVRMLATDPAGQGRGVGTRLLYACVDRARAGGRDAMFLYSTPWMETAHRIYYRAGFARVPPRDWLPIPDVPLWGFLLDLTVAG